MVCLYRARAVDTTKAPKMKRNNVNRYACGRINARGEICAIPETNY
jgi:hypothetical protein